MLLKSQKWHFHRRGRGRTHLAQVNTDYVTLDIKLPQIYWSTVVSLLEILLNMVVTNIFSHSFKKQCPIDIKVPKAYGTIMGAHI